MRKSVLLVFSTVLAALLASGVAWAATVGCRAGANRCLGTDRADTIRGSGVRDKINAKAGNDKVYANGGRDLVYGRDGADDLYGGYEDDGMQGHDGDLLEPDARGSGVFGLLRESREGISLWLSAIYGLLFLPMVLLAGAFLYAWVGYLGVGAWAAFLVLLEIWDRARRRRA